MEGREGGGGRGSREGGVGNDELAFFLGNFLTQTLSVILTTSGIFLLAFSTWQFSVEEPHCCYGDGIVNASALATDEQQNWNSMCKELHKDMLLGSTGLHLPTTLTMALALLGLVVSN